MEESPEVKIARIDENVRAIKENLDGMMKKIEKHDRDLLIGKVLSIVMFSGLAAKYPELVKILIGWLG